jgi:hypothetical protein
VHIAFVNLLWCTFDVTNRARPCGASFVYLNVWVFSSQTCQPCVSDLIAASEVENSDGGASSGQTRQPCVPDLIAFREIKSSDSGASSSKTRQPCVSDLIAAREVESSDGGASSSQTLQPCVSDLIAVREVESGDGGAPSSQALQPCLVPSHTATTAAQSGPPQAGLVRRESPAW